ncbi:uncharacterized protein LOC116291831, partial [Actinia tenebrosa]|uniref:Uncharacterized protein LOC116291831 n=1 Tax=Actinia tenebrosa TaxID=6105 RepID=A0A6P8HGE9_ACTTE
MYTFIIVTVFLFISPKDIGKLTCEAVPVIVKEGDNITLNCSASAYPPANYTWKSGNDIANTATVILPASPDLHDKSFTCTAANSRGSKNCSTAYVNVLYFDKNICKPSKLEWVSGNESRKVTYAIKGLCNPTPNLTCTSDVTDVSFGSDQYNVIVKTTVTGNKINYSCVFSNEVGNCSMAFIIWKRSKYSLVTY